MFGMPERVVYQQADFRHGVKVTAIGGTAGDPWREVELALNGRAVTFTVEEATAIGRALLDGAGDPVDPATVARLVLAVDAACEATADIPAGHPVIASLNAALDIVDPMRSTLPPVSTIRPQEDQPTATV